MNFQLHHNVKTSPDNYILDLVAPTTTQAHLNETIILGAPCSDNYFRLFDLNSETIIVQSKFQSASDEQACMSNACCTPDDPNVWWVSMKDGQGSVFMYDVRDPSPSKVVYKANAPVLSLSMNSNQSLLAVGTELSGDDAKIVFWDPRSGPASKLVEFVESHSDDVTQLQFHPTRPELLMSGSTDGLIVLYNMTTLLEEDAIHQTIKSNSIHKLGYFGPNYEFIYSMTHIETLSLWKFEDGDALYHYGDVRSQYSALSTIDYLVDCQYLPSTQQLLLFSGTQEGNISIWNINASQLDLLSNLNSGHSDIVRGIYFNKNNTELIYNAIQILRRQKEQAQRDISYLNFVKEEAIQNATEFIHLLKHSKEKLKLPLLQRIIKIPTVDAVSSDSKHQTFSVDPFLIYKEKTYATYKANLGFHELKPPEISDDYHPSIDGPHNQSTSLMHKLLSESTQSRSRDVISHAVNGLRPFTYTSSDSNQNDKGVIHSSDQNNEMAKKRKKNKLKSRTVGFHLKDKVQYLPLSVRISGANYLRRKASELTKDATIQDDPLEDVSSDEDSIPNEMKDSEEYQELLRLKKMMKLREGYIPPLNKSDPVHHGFSCDRCLIQPIIGIRHTCITCTENEQVDLCSECVHLPFSNETHDESHRFKEISIPEPQQWEEDPYSYLGL